MVHYFKKFLTAESHDHVCAMTDEQKIDLISPGSGSIFLAYIWQLGLEKSIDMWPDFIGFCSREGFQQPFFPEEEKEKSITEVMLFEHSRISTSL